MTKTSILILFVFASAACALTPVERAVVWTKSWCAVREHFAGFTEETLRQWEDGFDPALPELSSAPNDVEFWRQLRMKIAALGDGQTRLRLPRDLDLVYDTVPIRLMLAEDRVLVKRLSSSPAVQRSGIQVGDELLTVHGRAVGEVIRDECLPHVSGSTPSGRMAQAIWRVLTGPAGSHAVLELKKPGGWEYEATLKRDSGPDNRYYQELSARGAEPARTIEDRILYYDFGHTITQESEADVLARLDSAASLILDLRDVQFGFVPRALLARIAFFPLPMGASRDVSWRTRDAEAGNGVLALERKPHDVPAVMIEPAAVPFRGRIAILTSAATSGAAEQFLDPLVFAERVILVGDTTAGAGGSVITVELGNGARLNVTARRPNWEMGYGDGCGFPPDSVVSPTARALAEGRDETLTAALALLREP